MLTIKFRVKEDTKSITNILLQKKKIS